MEGNDRDKGLYWVYHFGRWTGYDVIPEEWDALIFTHSDLSKTSTKLRKRLLEEKLKSIKWDLGGEHLTVCNFQRQKLIQADNSPVDSRKGLSGRYEKNNQTPATRSI